MPHLLLVTDVGRRDLAPQILHNLQQRDFTISVASGPRQLRSAFPKADLILFDLSSPSEPLQDTIRELEEGARAREVPVMALVPEKALAGLGPESWFVDFLVEPFTPEELRLRVRRLLHATRRSEGREELLADDLVMNTGRYEVSLGDRLIDLTYKEYELLRFLLSHPGRVFSRETLLQQVWGYDFYGGTRTVDVHVRRLRGKIEDGTHSFIETVRNVGYRFRGKTETGR
jgi:DNA-binding response OmpR family regulator